MTIGPGNVASLGVEFRTTPYVDDAVRLPEVLVHGDTLFASGTYTPADSLARALPSAPDGTCSGSPPQCPSRWFSSQRYFVDSIMGDKLFINDGVLLKLGAYDRAAGEGAKKPGPQSRGPGLEGQILASVPHHRGEETTPK